MIKRIPKNHVLVEVDCLRHKKIAFKNGSEIIVDPNFAKEQHAQTHGIVRAIPEALYFNNKDVESSEYRVPITVKPGDKVFFHYLQINKAVQRYKTIYENGKYYIFIKYESLFCGIRDDKVIMFNGWMLLKPIALAVDKEKKYIDTIPRNRQDHDPLMGEIAHVGEPVEEYFYGSESDKGVDVSAGDKVIFLPHSDIPLEYPMHQSLDQKYFRVQRKELLSIYVN
jgi:hypothetical protein